MASTQTGRNSLERIERAGGGVDIQPHRGGGANCNRYDDTGAFFDDINNRPSYGSDSVISYEPGRNYAPESPSDVVLNHEMGHAANNAEGINRRQTGFADAADEARWSNMEEHDVINNVENPYRQERGFTTPRTSHSSAP
jgi:hypothetical protein